MEIKDTVFLVYDFMFNKSQIREKKAYLYDLLDKHATLIIFSEGSVRNGKDLSDIRMSLDSLIKENKKIHPLCWNGAEWGCESWRLLLREYGLEGDLIYIEQGLLPQENYLRFLSKPLHNLKNLGFTKKSSQWFDQNNNKNELKKYIEDRLDECRIPLHPQPVRLEPVKNKICIIMQLSHDSSLFPLKNPTQDYPELVAEKLKSIYKDNYKNLQFVGCPHPKNKDDAFQFNMSYFKGIKASLYETTKQCMDSELVVGFNSTILTELHFRKVPLLVLDEQHHLNENVKDDCNFYLSSKIKAAQFNPKTISYEEFLIQKATYLKLSKNA